MCNAFFRKIKKNKSKSRKGNGYQEDTGKAALTVHMGTWYR